MGDAYDFRPGGSLKLKGDKKKKRKTQSDEQRIVSQTEIERAARIARLEAEGVDADEAREGSAPPEGSAGPASKKKKTPAEEKFDKIQEDRRRERAAKKAKLTHKDRVADFNASLDRLSEHHDMPRIGPG